MTRDSELEHDPQLAAAYRAGSQEQPPAHLDAAIRAAARREVGAGPARGGTTPVRVWGVPLSLAAVVVLSVTVVLMMREEGMDRPDALTRPVPAGNAPRSVEADAARKKAPSAESKDSVASPLPAATPAPVAAPAGPASAPELKQRAADAELRALDATAARAKTATGRADEEGDPGARRERMQAAPAAPPALLRSAPASAVGESAAGAGMLSRPPAAALADAPAKTALWGDLIAAPPEKWLQRIADLRRDGKTADADAVVAEFRRRFPAERVPEELR